MANEETRADHADATRTNGGHPTPPSVTSHLDELADELRSVAGLRSRNAIRDRVFPNLMALLPVDSRNDPERRYAALQHLIEAGLADMPDGDHRNAASALLAYDNGRWRPLTKRGSEAAATFGLGWDAYRRRRDSTGSSLVLETMTELAGVLVGDTRATTPTPPTNDGTVAPVHLSPEPVTPAVPAVPAEPARAPSAPKATSQRSRRSAAVAAIALAVIVVVAGGYWYQNRTISEPVSCGNLTNEPGDHADGVDDEIVRWSKDFASTARKIPDGGAACAGKMSQRDGVVYQELSGGIDSGVSAIVVATDGNGEIVVLDHLEFFQYRSEAWDPEKAAPGIGVPVRRVDQDDGLRVVEFTNGVLVQEQTDVPAVAVVGEFWTRWLDTGGFDGLLGTPVSNVYDRPGTARIQEFFTGNLAADYRSGVISASPHTPDDQALPDGYPGAVLVSTGTNTSWFVGDDGIRHWLPTSNDFGCVKLFHKAATLTDVPHAAIARLRVGEPMRCR